MNLAMDIVATVCVICGGENGTNGCHLVVFSVDVLAYYFITPLPPHRSPTAIGYASKTTI